VRRGHVTRLARLTPGWSRRRRTRLRAAAAAASVDRLVLVMRRGIGFGFRFELDAFILVLPDVAAVTDRLPSVDLARWIPEAAHTTHHVTDDVIHRRSRDRSVIYPGVQLPAPER